MTTVVPLSLRLRPIVNWVRVDNGSNVVSSAVTQITPTTTLVTLSLKPSLHDNIGTYQCIANLSIPMVTSFHIERDYNLFVRREYTFLFLHFNVNSFQTVPPPNVVCVSDDPGRFFIAGTNRTITCTASFTNVDDILTVNFKWTQLVFSPTFFTMDFETHNTSHYKNQSIFTSHLSFNLLNESLHIIACNVIVYFFDRLVAQRNSGITLHRKL